MAVQNTPEVRKLAKDYMIGKQFNAKFLGSLTISDAKEDAAGSLKFIRASNLTSSNKQPTAVISLKLKGISVFAGPTKLAAMEAPIERVIYVCHDPEDVTAFGVVIKTQDRGLRLHAFQSDETTAISFVHSSEELFQLALKIVKAKQKLYNQEQQYDRSDPPPPYASVIDGSLLRAATITETHSTSEERPATVSAIRRKETFVEGTCAVPRPSRRASMITTGQQKEAPKLLRAYSVDQQNEAKCEDNMQIMSEQDLFPGLGGASSLFSPPRNAKSTPGSVGLTSSGAPYAKMDIDVAGALSPTQTEFIPQWQSSPLTQNTYQSPIGQNRSPLCAGLDVSQISLSLPNPLYNSTVLTSSPQNGQYLAETFPFPPSQLPTISPNQASLQTTSSQRVRVTGIDHLVSTQLETGGAEITSKTAKGVSSSMGAVNTLSHTDECFKECTPLDSGKQSHSGSLRNAFEGSFHPALKPSSSENTQPHNSNQATVKGNLQIQSNSHAPASPFEDDFLPTPQANGNLSNNTPANATVKSSASVAHMFEDSFLPIPLTNENELNSPANATINSTPSAITPMFEDSFLPIPLTNENELNSPANAITNSTPSATTPMFEDSFLPIPLTNENELNSPANATTNSTPSAITPMFEDSFLPIPLTNENELNSPANATTNSTPSAIAPMFEDSFLSSPAHILTGDSYQSFESSFQSSLSFNSFDDNFNTLVSQNIEHRPTFEPSTTALYPIQTLNQYHTKHINQQPSV